LHPSTPQAEVETAMKLAQRRMKKFNTTQAAVLVARGSGAGGAGDGTLRGGLVKVHLRSIATGAPLASLARWMDFLMGA